VSLTSAKKSQASASNRHEHVKADVTYIRRAVELADLDAVRMTLYHLTQDPELTILPVAAKLDATGREWLIQRAVAWLQKHAGPGQLADPSDAEARRMMDMAVGTTMGDLEFEMRRDILAFKDFPFMAEWAGAKPPIPTGFKVVIIGSGFNGIATAIQFGRLGIPYVVYERRSEPGGTWTVNRYPDVRVDTMSINYEFNFQKEHRWSEYFARGPEVRSYLEMVARNHGVWENTRFSSDVKSATFDAKRSVWRLEIETPTGIETTEANVVITCVGLFLNPKIADFEGRDSFLGQIIHPARWPAEGDLKGKQVAIIGNGSTGVQLLAPIAEANDKVYVFQRTPQWISPRDKYGVAIPPEINWLLDNFPGYWNWSRYMNCASIFETHDFFIPDPRWRERGGKFNEQNDRLRETLTAYIKQETGGRQDLIDKLIPDYAPFSRRPVVDNNWYRALTRDNVELVTDGIARFTPKGIQTVDGKLREVDVIVTATGFDVARFLEPTQYKGRGGVDLHQMWEAGDGPRAYLGMMVPGFPNLFMSYGPNSQPVSGGTQLPVWFVIWGAYAAKCVMHMLEHKKSCVEVKAEAHDRYNVALDEEGRKIILMDKEGAPEKNYYNNVKYNRIQVSAPWYAPRFQRMCSVLEWDDLIVT
jgi:4-hydroxyacetophenone monooxygenase